MTAHIFLKLSNLLDSNTEHPMIFCKESKLYKFWNVVNLSRTDINVELSRNQEDDAGPDNVFHVYGFQASKVKTSDIFNWFSKFGKVTVQWKDDTSAFVIINDRLKLSDAIEFSEKNHENFFVESLSSFRAQGKRLSDSSSSISTPSTPPPDPLHTPPERTRRSSLKRPAKKRPRPSSIGFSDTFEEPERKLQKTEHKSFECCIS